MYKLHANILALITERTHFNLFAISVKQQDTSFGNKTL